MIFSLAAALGGSSLSLGRCVQSVQPAIGNPLFTFLMMTVTWISRLSIQEAPMARFDILREPSTMQARGGWLEKLGLAEAKEVWIDGTSKI